MHRTTNGTHNVPHIFDASNAPVVEEYKRVAEKIALAGRVKHGGSMELLFEHAASSQGALEHSRCWILRAAHKEDNDS